MLLTAVLIPAPEGGFTALNPGTRYAPCPIAVQCSQSVFAHETRYSMFAACLPGFTKVKKNAWGPEMPWLALNDARINLSSLASS